MVRQHPAADGDRPHFFSQYWINVALGKPTTEEAAAAAHAAANTATAEPIEPEFDLPTPPIAFPRPEPVKPPKRIPEKKPEPARLSSLADLANIEELMKSSQALPDDMVPDIEAENALAAEPTVITDFDLAAAANEPAAVGAAGAGAYEDEDEYDFEEDEDEENNEWGGRRPGKGPKKPSKPQKPPRRREF